MARTYRNKNTVPPGWTIRDNGWPYYNGYDRWGNEEGERLRHRFGRQHRFEVPRYRRSRYKCEKKRHRKAHFRSYRAKMKNLIRHEEWEKIRPFRRTSGWISY
jgi:hypothetical protein